MRADQGIDALLANRELAVCFAEHADLDACAFALNRLAQEFAGMNARLSEFPHIDAPFLCDLVHAYARSRPADAFMQKAMRELAGEVSHRVAGDADYFNAEQRRILLAGFDLRQAYPDGLIGSLQRPQAPQLNERPLVPGRLAMVDARKGIDSTSGHAADEARIARQAKMSSKAPKSRASQEGITLLTQGLLRQAGPMPALASMHGGN